MVAPQPLAAKPHGEQRPAWKGTLMKPKQPISPQAFYPDAEPGWRECEYCRSLVWYNNIGNYPSPATIGRR